MLNVSSTALLSLSKQAARYVMYRTLFHRRRRRRRRHRSVSW